MNTDLRLERVPITHPDALLLVEEVQEEYVVRYGGRDDTPLDPAAFDPPGGAFYVGYLGDEPVATGAWRRRTDVEVFDTRATAEIKRMYVVAAHRGEGLARRMLAHLEVTAAEEIAPGRYRFVAAVVDFRRRRDDGTTERYTTPLGQYHGETAAEAEARAREAVVRWIEAQQVR